MKRHGSGGEGILTFPDTLLPPIPQPEPPRPPTAVPVPAG